jgi:hypothetical protein
MGGKRKYNGAGWEVREGEGGEGEILGGRKELGGKGNRWSGVGGRRGYDGKSGGRGVG